MNNETNNINENNNLNEQNNIENNVENPKKKNNKMIFIIVGILVVAIIIAIVFLVLNKPSSDDNKKEDKKDTEEKISLDDAIVLEDVDFNGYGCINTKCTLYFGEDYETEYLYNEKTLSKYEDDLFLVLDGYEDYIKVNVYYVENEKGKTIVGYKMFSKSTNEELKDVENEEELRDKLHLYQVGSYTESLTLVEKGELSFGFTVDPNTDEEEEFTSIDCIFTDDSNNKYEMKYKNPDENMNLVEGNKYTVSFEVEHEFKKYEYIITSIE